MKLMAIFLTLFLVSSIHAGSWDDFVEAVREKANAGAEFVQKEAVPAISETYNEVKDKIKESEIPDHVYGWAKESKMHLNHTLNSLMDEATSPTIWPKIVLGYYVAVNIICLVYMAVDKMRAQEGAWRISECTLWFWALIGGAIGGICGMLICWHKVRNCCFVVGMPLLVGLHAYLLYHFEVFQKL